MKLRHLRKQDKRAEALLIGTMPRQYSARDFAQGCEGRHSYYHCDYWGEWDERAARGVWEDHRYNDHPNACAWMGFDPATGASIPKDQRPRRMLPHERREWYALRPPAGYRWRGRRVVPVDQHGAMVCAAKQKGGA